MLVFLGLSIARLWVHRKLFHRWGIKASCLISILAANLCFHRDPLGERRKLFKIKLECLIKAKIYLIVSHRWDKILIGMLWLQLIKIILEWTSSINLSTQKVFLVLTLSKKKNSNQLKSQIKSKSISKKEWRNWIEFLGSHLMKWKFKEISIWKLAMIWSLIPKGQGMISQRMIKIVLIKAASSPGSKI
jgi:hypothetical protein